jgi:glycosyltransferase involved in cell wall biosynthesis
VTTAWLGRVPEGGGSPSEVSGAEPRATGPAGLADMARDAGLRRVGIVAWRDLEDAEAGGSELHAHEIARRWAKAGIEVVLRTSATGSGPQIVRREGYQAVRRSGRYAVFAGAPFDVVSGRLGRLDGLVEIWNGMPFLSPLWFRGPSIVFLHHVHAEMWQMVLSPNLARAGSAFESRLAPHLYRRSRIVTLSSSSRHEIVDMLRMHPGLVTVVPPGVGRCFSPAAGDGLGDAARSPTPLVAAVGRLVPVKRFTSLIAAAGALAPLHPQLRVVIAGEGYERPKLEAAVAEAGLSGMVSMPGHMGGAELVALYRRAWVLVAASAREGWGMTVTEAGACGTPAVASRIAGHLDSVEHGVSGILFRTDEELVRVLGEVLGDSALRARLAKGALARAGRFTWDTAAAGTLAALAGEVGSRRQLATGRRRPAGRE